MSAPATLPRRSRRDARSRLAAIELRRLRPAPGELEADEGGDGDGERGVCDAAQRAARPRASGGDGDEEERHDEDEMARFRRRRRAEAREHQQRGGGEDDGSDEDRAAPPRPREPVGTEGGERDHDRHGEPIAGDEVAGGLREIAQHVERGAEATSASADADLEAAGEDEVGAPERDAEHEDDRERQPPPRGVAASSPRRTPPGRPARARRTDAPRRRAAWRRSTPPSGAVRPPPSPTAEPGTRAGS